MLRQPIRAKTSLSFAPVFGSAAFAIRGVPATPASPAAAKALEECARKSLRVVIRKSLVSMKSGALKLSCFPGSHKKQGQIKVGYCKINQRIELFQKPIPAALM
jgi:hypothetical protein